jgi:2-haloacid dehalogenase
MIDAGRFSHLTFDCYGTLIDWESGILAALRRVFDRHRVQIGDADALELYARLEAECERGEYRRYAAVLRGVMAGFGAELGFAPTVSDLEALPLSVREWPPFPDTVEALHRLARRYALGILSNIDDDMFAASARRLEVPFVEVVTAQQVGSYKPAPAHFEVALERLGVPRERILHVAQSRYHDHAPARRLGFASVWINRRSRVPGFGATPPAEVAADLELPDLQSLADALDC